MVTTTTEKDSQHRLNDLPSSSRAPAIGYSDPCRDGTQGSGGGESKADDLSPPLAGDNNEVTTMSPAKSSVVVREVPDSTQNLVAKQPQPDASVPSKQNDGGGRAVAERLAWMKTRSRRSKGQAASDASNGSQSHRSSLRDVTPGAVLVGGVNNNDHHLRTTTLLSDTNDLENPAIDQDPETTSSMLVTAQLVDLDAGDSRTVESQIQQQVESRLLMQQNNAIVAEPVDTTKVSLDATGANRKILGIRRKVWSYVMAIAVMMIGATVGVVVSQHLGTFTDRRVQVTGAMPRLLLLYIGCGSHKR